MSPVPTSSPFNINELPQLIAAVGALGLAAMGLVEAVGKTVVFDSLGLKIKMRVFGLPYAGYGPVKRFVRLVGPALEVCYGQRYAAMIINQYRAGRGTGQAPDTIRQGVRLGLPYLSDQQARRVIGAVWGMEADMTKAFAASLRASAVAITPVDTPAAPAIMPAAAQTLAARFATALDTRVQAAFDAAEQDYQAYARFWAGVAAVALSLGYTYATIDGAKLGDWLKALLVGLVAVPLAPIAKDVSTSLSQALTALGQIRGKIKN